MSEQGRRFRSKEEYWEDVCELAKPCADSSFRVALKEQLGIEFNDYDPKTHFSESLQDAALRVLAESVLPVAEIAVSDKMDAYDTLCHTLHKNAFIENGGNLDDLQSVPEMLAKFAYWSAHEDLMEAAIDYLDRLLVGEILGISVS